MSTKRYIICNKYIISNNTIGKPVSRNAIKWLDEMCANDGQMLAAMLADGADEGLAVVRTVDQHRTQAARLHAELKHFLQRIDKLFVGGQCFTSFGYTKLVSLAWKQTNGSAFARRQRIDNWQH